MKKYMFYRQHMDADNQIFWARSWSTEERRPVSAPWSWTERARRGKHRESAMMLTQNETTSWVRGPGDLARGRRMHLWEKATMCVCLPMLVSECAQECLCHIKHSVATVCDSTILTDQLDKEKFTPQIRYPAPDQKGKYIHTSFLEYKRHCWFLQRLWVLSCISKY